ncbi:MAG: diguanylate cyclase [Paraglaciecola sp.]|uniref:sensor domain-containing diguanylate cyclase n=1 Tax=Paraglaciecola sp. TaxID=1920173 RepID=UPI00329A6BF7
MSINPFAFSISRNAALALTLACCLLIFIITNHFISDHTKASAQVNNYSYLVDPTQKKSITHLLNLESQDWRSNTSDIYSPSASTDVHWLKFTAPKLSPLKNWLLEIDNPLLNEVNVWFVQNNIVISQYSAGDAKPFYTRPILQENFVFTVPLHNQPIDIYIRASSTVSMRLPIYLWPQELYLSNETTHSITMGIFIGLMVTMGLCSLFSFIATRAVSFLVYSGYVVSLVLTITTLHGFAFRYIWPNAVFFQQHAAVFFASCLLCFSTIFCDQLLDVKSYNLHLSKLLKILASIFLLGAGLSFLIPQPIYISALLFMTLLNGLITFLTGILLWRKGSAIAHYYTLAWTMLYVLGVSISLDSLNIFKFSVSPEHYLMLGATLETIFLALILIFSHYKQKQTELSEQARLLDIERQNRSTEQAVIEQQKTATEELEYKVQERTLELEITLRELSEKNQELEKKNTLDALTGIRNRSYFDKKYQAELRRSKREQTKLSIVMLDIDHFKSVNDIHGHLMGDECIKVVANILKQSLKRPSDTVCRYGGEEFAMILPSTDLEGALALVEKIRKEIFNTDIILNNDVVKVTVSAGVGTATADFTVNEKSILAVADQQLYKAKNAGRNQTLGCYLS